MMSIAVAAVQDFRLEPKAFIYFLQLGKCSDFDIGRRNTIEVNLSCYSQSHVIQFTPTLFLLLVLLGLYGVRF